MKRFIYSLREMCILHCRGNPCGCPLSELLGMGKGKNYFSILTCMDEVANLENAIRRSNLLGKYNLEKIGIFGSFARREPANDIDFYIEANNCKLSELKRLKTELENLTNKRIDIMLKKYANPIVLHRALKDMIYVSA